MPINDFRKINIGSVLNEVGRVVKLLQTVLVLLLVLDSTSIGSEQFSQCSYQDCYHAGVHRTHREAKMVACVAGIERAGY